MILLRFRNVLLRIMDFVGFVVCNSLVAVGFSTSPQLVYRGVLPAHGRRRSTRSTLADREMTGTALGGTAAVGYRV
jgi:hypothetical protein